MSKDSPEKILKKRIASESDFIHHPRCNNSIETFMSKHPNGVPDIAISKVLLMSEKEVEEEFQEAIENLKESLEVDEN